MASPAKPAEILITPTFGPGFCADNRREEFNIRNGVLLTHQVPVDMLFIGDSITHFWPLDVYFHRFGRSVNRGIAGDLAQTICRRFEGDAIQLHPRLCVLMMGINNTWELDTPTSADAIYALVTDSYRQVLEMAKAHRLPMLCGSVLPVADRSEIGQKRNRLVCRFNEALQTMCAAYDAVYVDYHTALVDEDGLSLRDGLSFDGLHPHVIGYDRMAEVLTPHLEKHLSV